MPAHRRHDENRCEKVQASMTATTQIELLIGPDVDLPEHWRYSSARSYLGGEGLLEIRKPWT